MSCRYFSSFHSSGDGDNGQQRRTFWRQFPRRLNVFLLVNFPGKTRNSSGGHSREAGKFQCAVRPLRKKSNQPPLRPLRCPTGRPAPSLSAHLPPTADEWSLSISFISMKKFNLVQWKMFPEAQRRAKSFWAGCHGDEAVTPPTDGAGNLFICLPGG
jgi:hypothetical protein